MTTSLPEYITLRDATDADSVRITQIINLAYRVEDAFAIGDRMALDTVRAMIAEPNGRFLVIEWEGGPVATIAGTVYVRIDEGRGYFGPLGVDPQFQGKGLGKMLVQSVESYCRMHDCQHLDLDVLSLRPELIPFYEAMDFVVTGTADYTGDSQFRQPAHLILMTKSL